MGMRVVHNKSDTIMAKKNNTIFQNLNSAISGDWGKPIQHTNTYDMSGNNNVIYRTTDKNDYETKKLELQQDNWLQNRWLKANLDLSMSEYNGLNNVKMMYRDADLMDNYPEIGAVLDTVAEESSIASSKNNMIVNVFSKSDRIKSVIEDLLVNRLNLNVTAVMVIRALCKYGNQFMLLDVDRKSGVKGWRQLPVYDVDRIENGITNPYGSGRSALISQNSDESKLFKTEFVWNGGTNNQIPFKDWQIAHFRLLTNSLFLPYGISFLNSSRRHWRLLSIMEDMMLLYRMERSIERRVYKVFVGNIDPQDVGAYMDEIANRFKRTPIVDPMTGQIDLRKNFSAQDTDIFIPVRNENAPTPIDTLSAAQNLTAIDDIKFVQNKLFTGLRVPKSFVNYEEAQGDGKNLALLDVRFTRTINRIQQAFLMELTKVVSIHLYLLGFEDDLTNFSLTMNNPSTQAEQLEVDTLQKKIAAARDAVSDPGNGIPIMSQMRALREIMKWSDKDIKENLEEIRLEKGLAAELDKTAQIIKRTGMFDTVDRIYGEPGAEYQEEQQQGGPEGMDGGMPGGGGGGSFGGGLDDLGAPGMEGEGDISGEEGVEPTEEMGLENGGPEQPEVPEQPMESKIKDVNKLLTEQQNKVDALFSEYIKKVDKKEKNKNNESLDRVDIYDKSLLINDEFDSMIKSINQISKESPKRKNKK